MFHLHLLYGHPSVLSTFLWDKKRGQLLAVPLVVSSDAKASSTVFCQAVSSSLPAERRSYTGHPVYKRSCSGSRHYSRESSQEYREETLQLPASLRKHFCPLHRICQQVEHETHLTWNTLSMLFERCCWC